MMLSALVGVVLAFSAHLILNTINPQITKIDISQLASVPEEELEEGGSDFKKSDLKAHAMPLDSAIKEVIGKDDHLPRIRKLVTEDLKNHINATFTVDEEIANQEYRHGIASFGKYNHHLATKCSCQNLKGQCGPPSHTAMCAPPSGDTCKSAEGFEDEDGGPDPCHEDVREEMDNKLIDLANFIKNEGATNDPNLTEFQTDLETLYNKIQSERGVLQRKLSAFETIEYNLTAAEWQKNIDSHTEFLDRLDRMLNPEKGTEDVATTYESKREIIEVLPSAISEKKFTPLTFYELFYEEIDPVFREKLLAESLPSQIRREEKLTLSHQIEVGQLMDKVRENTIVMLGRMEEISNLIEEMEGQLAEVMEGVSKCNDSDCGVSCNCVPNPFVFFGGPPCLQCVGGCNGLACSGAKADLIETTKELEETENKLLKEIDKFKIAADKSPLYLKNTEDLPFETLNLRDVQNKVVQCQSKKGWDLITCEHALGHALETENGKVIESCHPRDYFCARTEKVEDIDEPKFTKLYSPGYLLDYATSSNVGGCPENWECSQDIKSTDQYKDTSTPLKRFFTCFRKKLDKKKKENEIEDLTIASLINISDPSLYQDNKVCNWTKGGKDCNYPFKQELFKERVSAHYGGERCHAHIKKSYAAQFKYDPAYIDLLVEAANTCLDSSNINISSPYLDISIAGAYRCGVE